MAPAETSNSEDDPLTPSPSEERPLRSPEFRSQYHQLHRSLSLTNNVESLKSRFEKQEEKNTEEKKGPKPKIQLVAKSDLIGYVTGTPEKVEKVEKEQPKPKIQLVEKSDLIGYVAQSQATEEKVETVEERPIPKKRLSKVTSDISSGTNGTLSKETKPQKRVSFSFETIDEAPPVPKPRLSAVIQQVIVETSIIEPALSRVETVILNEPPTPSDLDKIEFADPEERHYVTRQEKLAQGSVENIKKALDEFTMDTKKKRSPSFRSKLLTIFTKDKDKKPKDKEKDDNKKTKKTENAVFADNAQNENFNRHSTQRHTIDTPRREPKPQPNVPPNHQQSFHEAMHPDQKAVEQRYAAMHIQNYQQVRNSFVSGQQQQPLANHQQHHPTLLRKLSQEHGVYNPSEDYVCMDNKNDAKNYINIPKYDSSSTNTIESENSTTSVNPLQQVQQERMAIRSRFFNESGTPPRAQDTNQSVQMVNPKAAIPINTERPLPNPYQQQQPSPQARNESPYHMQQHLPLQPRQLDDNDLADSGYGTVYDRNSRPMSAGSSDLSGGSMSSPRSPSVERTKLRLPQNREKIDLQPRIRSPIPPSEVSTDKLIATELLKTNKKGDKKDRDRSSPSHQKLQLEIDYPELHDTICDVVDQAAPNQGNNQNQHQNELSITSFHRNDVSSSSFNTTDNNVNSLLVNNSNTSNDGEVSRDTLLEAGDWHRVQRDLCSSPSLKNVQITTNALVHVDSPHRASTPSQDGRSRSVTPVMMMRRNSNASLQRSPPKHEIRQTVEAFCWKELKKLKEKEDFQMQMLVGPMISSCGYAEDPIRRSRSMTRGVTQDSKRSTSLPREVRQRRTEDIELNARRMAQQQRFNTGPQRSNEGQTRPIFNRGSLTQQNVVDQPIYSKKVSFRSQNIHPDATSWPTKNGFTQSPPQRRLDGDNNGGKDRESLEDDVFLPQSPQSAQTPHTPQQSPQGPVPSRDEIFMLNQQRQKELLMAKAQRSNAPVTCIDGASQSVVDNASVISDVPPMRNIREPIYGTRPPVPSVPMHQKQPMNESPYGTRVNVNDPNVRVVTEPIYGTRNAGMPRMNESSYGTRNPSPNGYNMHRNESLYGSRPGAPNRSMNESPYGTRNYPANGMPPIEEPIYGTKQSAMMSHEAIYGSRPSMIREPIYGTRQVPPPRMESPYGTRANPAGQKLLPGYPPPGYQENPYGSRPPSQQNGEVLYGYRMGNGSVRSESPYGARPPLPMTPNQQYYRPGPRIGPPLPPGGPGAPGGPGRANLPPGLKRSNSLRQAESPESLYVMRPSYNKPPSGAQYRRNMPPNQMELSPNGPLPPQGRYDFPPPDQEPIYGRKVNTVSNKVCDIYGNIYDASKAAAVPVSPPPLQKAGVLYGQLQRNANAPPVVYQSHQQLQPNNFQRGTRLTASVNDMHRYNSNANVTQRTEPPQRPLPPIPDEPQKKSRFGFGRKKHDAGKGK